MFGETWARRRLLSSLMGFVRGLGNNVYVLMPLKRGTSIIYPSWLQQGALVRVASNGVFGSGGSTPEQPVRKWSDI
jgi:hypothetical protein